MPKSFPEKKHGPRLKKNAKTNNLLVRIFIVISLLILWSIFFQRLHNVVGDGAFAITNIIPVVAGALLGTVGGLSFGAISSPVVISLAIQSGYSVEQALRSGIPATLVLLITGAGVGLFRNLMIRLRLEVQERRRAAEELKKSKEAAEAANRAKSEFLANMSHELRTPLNHIIGFTEIVVDKKFGDLNKVQEEYLNDALRSSKHLLSLINDILDLSKVEAGKMELNASDVNPKQILANSLLMIKETAMKHKIELCLDVDGIPETIRADERKFKQIIYNLLSNAVKFTPERGSINIAAGRLSPVGGHLEGIDGEKISWPRDADEWPAPHTEFIKISVKDTGIGLNEKDLERIFHPFDQVDASLARRYPGTGLGLSLTKNFVELHGGRIWAQSDGKNRGSTFSFIMPL